MFQFPPSITRAVSTDTFLKLFRRVLIERLVAVADAGGRKIGNSLPQENDKCKKILIFPLPIARAGSSVV